MTNHQTPAQSSSGSDFTGGGLAAIARAIERDQQTLDNSRDIFSKAVLMNVTMSEAITNYWNNILKRDATNVAANESGGINASGHYQKPNKNDAATWQERFNADSAFATRDENQQDGTVQSSQQQTSALSSDLQMLTEPETSVNQIQAILTNDLGHVTA